jgi:hypothetical protein
VGGAPCFHSRYESSRLRLARGDRVTEPQLPLNPVISLLTVHPRVSPAAALGLASLDPMVELVLHHAAVAGRGVGGLCR